MLKPDDFYRALREVEFTMVESLVKKALAEGHPAPQILNEGLIAGMSIIGQEFKARDLWVPDVLLAARNMQRGIEILKPLFSKEGQGFERENHPGNGERGHPRHRQEPGCHHDDRVWLRGHRLGG